METFDSGSDSGGLAVLVRDTSGQRARRVSNLPPDATVDELVSAAVSGFGLARNEAGGEPISYTGLLEREGRQLIPSERVGEVLREDDEVVLVRSIDAGRGRRG